jgi:hypothetical protein
VSLSLFFGGAVRHASHGTWGSSSRFQARRDKQQVPALIGE